MKIKNILLITLLMIFSFPLFSQEKKKVVLRWKETSTAIFYIVEIRNKEKEIIFKEKLEDTSIPVELIPGNYERRISIINKLGEEEVTKEWAPFKIVLLVAPELESEEPVELFKDENPVKLKLKGKNFSKDMEVKIRKGELDIPIQKVDVQDENNAIVEINPEELPEGKYDIILENKRKQKKVMGYIVAKNPSEEEKPVEEPVTEEKEERKIPEDLKKWEIVKRSAILPGWGEYYAGQKINEPKYDLRGKIYFGSFAFSTFLYLYFNEFTFIPGKKTPTQKEFEEESTKNLAIAFVLPNLSNNVRRVTALYGLQRTQELSDKYDTQVQRTNTMLLIMGGIYIIQLVDAYLIERKLNLSFDNSFFEKYQFSMSPVKIGNQVETKYDFGYTLKF